MPTENKPATIYLGPACEAETGDGRTWAEDDPWPTCDCGHQSVRYVLGETFDRVAAESLALQQRLTTADERIDELEQQLKARDAQAAAYTKPVDYWEGFGYCDFSCTTDLRRMVSHLEGLLDAIPDGPLYTLADAGEVDRLREEVGGLEQVLKLQVEALKALIFAARTTGGTAGPDQGLIQACEKAEHAISLDGIGKAYMTGADSALSASAGPAKCCNCGACPGGCIGAKL